MMNKRELIEIWEHTKARNASNFGIVENSLIDDFIGDLEELEEPETLSQKWIANNEIEGLLINGDEYEMVVPVEKVQKLLQPKQESSKETETVASVLADFYTSTGRLKEVLSMEVEIDD